MANFLKNSPGKKKFRVLVCGNSFSNNPRDSTLYSALQNINEVEILDLRFMRDLWESRAFQKFDRGKIPSSAWKRYLYHKIKSLVSNQSIDLIFLMKINAALLRKCVEWRNDLRIPIAYDLWVSRTLAAERDGLDTTSPFLQEDQVLQHSDFPFATARAYKEYYSKTFNCNSKKIGVIPLAVTDEWLNIDRKVNDDHSNFIVSYWGNFLKHHGVHVLLDAARKLESHQDIQFHLYGSEKYGNEEHILQGMPSNVKYFGRYSTQKLIGRIDFSNVGVGHLLPIHDAHLMLPNKALEGMARSKPVIHIDHPNFYPEYGSPESDSRSVVYYQGGSEYLAATILNLKQNELLSRKIGANALKKIEMNHSIEAVEKALQQFDFLER